MNEYLPEDFVCKCMGIGRKKKGCTLQCRLYFVEKLGQKGLVCVCREHSNYYFPVPIDAPNNSWPSLWRTVR